eukprot:3984603-Prymnesium_polylepis.1
MAARTVLTMWRHALCSQCAAMTCGGNGRQGWGEGFSNCAVAVAFVAARAPGQHHTHASHIELEGPTHAHPQKHACGSVSVPGLAGSEAKLLITTSLAYG